MDKSRIDLAAIRKEVDLSQAELAKEVGVSQATISRLEKGEYEPDLRLWSKLARALKMDVRELAPEDLFTEITDLERDYFFAFCPNPFCERNESELKNGIPIVRWRSSARYPMARFSEVNFCSRCGTELVKDCPGCSRPIEDSDARFCISCGTRITNRPTDEEWAAIRGSFAPEDDDIPF